jgi:hypothetical protein
VSVASQQSPKYFAVLAPFAGLALMIWWLIH